jgi:glutathione S-transferase
MSTLVSLAYSPWSQKARWALDHHHVPYRVEPYLPMLGEPLLRARLRRPFGQVTVPVLFTDDGPIADSLAIARYAERMGSGAPLFPLASLDAIERWNARSDVAMRAGRTLVTRRTLESPGAQAEALPKFIPPGARPFLRGMAYAGARYLALKYGLSTDTSPAEEALAAELEALRAALAGRPYLLDDFTYADIAMAVVLQMVRPVRDAFVRLGPATRDAWTIPSLADRFADLVAWRDALYEKHRRD